MAAKPRNQSKSARDENGRILSVAEIRDTEDRIEDTVEVPEWGGSVRIRELSQGLSGKIIEEVLAAGEDNSTYGLQQRLTVRHGVIEPELTDDDVAMLEQKSLTAVSRIAEAIEALSEDTKENREKRRKSFRARAGA